MSLEFIPTQELIDELAKRQEASIIILENEDRDKEVIVRYDCRGTKSHAIGLLEYVKHAILAEIILPSKR